MPESLKEMANRGVATAFQRVTDNEIGEAEAFTWILETPPTFKCAKWSPSSSSNAFPLAISEQHGLALVGNGPLIAEVDRARTHRRPRSEPPWSRPPPSSTAPLPPMVVVGRLVREIVKLGLKVAFFTASFRIRELKDKEDKAERLLAETASYGSRLVEFPEAFVGDSSFGVTIGNCTARGKEEFRKYHAAAIDMPGKSLFCVGPWQS
ncbi:hypothetical protein Acr_19g0002190 [Actinidia rufa]|uniref:Uncharacterized protein n=1 Tax=Actinidia rufa TaxID=165716 RepID=A0A7J0G972_9ERIC|nr:hypothetical protein Acr_19g0002190 [Actinidia rufa]